MELKKRWVAVIVIVLVMIGAMQAASIRPSVVNGQAGGDGSDAPYIQYYSPFYQSVVIERADGTDKRFLGKGYTSPEWSPSGKWVHVQEYGRYSQIISVDGTRVLSSIGESICNGQWSPVEDILACVIEKQPLSFGPVHEIKSYFEIRLIDATTDTILTSVSLEFWGRVRRLQQNGWRADGQGFVVALEQYYWFDGGPDLVSVQTTYVAVSKDGTVTQRKSPGDEYSRPRITPYGEIAYLSSDALVLENLFSGSRQVFKVPTIDVNRTVLSVWWNPSKTGAVVEIEEDYKVHSLWWMEKHHLWPDLSITRWNLISNRLSRTYDATIWEASPTMKYVAFADNHDYMHFYNTSTHEIVDLPLKVAPIWGELYRDYAWLNDDSLVLFPDFRLRNATLIIDAPTQKITPTKHAGGVIAPPGLSADGRYRAWVGDSPETYDLATRTQVVMRPDGRGYVSHAGGYVEWHPKAAWFFYYDNGLVASGGAGPYYPGVASADGSMMREIYTYPSDIGWLPPQVNPEELPPPVEVAQPVIVLPIGDWTSQILWSADSQFLVAANGYPIEWEVTLWDVAEGNAVKKSEMADLRNEMGWADELYPLPEMPSESAWEDAEALQRLMTYWQTAPFSPDGKWVMLIDGVHEVATGALVFERPKQLYPLRGSHFSPDSRLLALVSDNGPLGIWDTQTWQWVGGAETYGKAVAFSPDGEYLAVGVSWDVEIWRVSDLIGETVPTPSPSPTH